ncbi:toprim domain-containing protein [Deinococcus arenicola]|uniref:Bifunctional DNA primase/polymerase n=1 Tax=Deinococcus arenicola TaxID=2994950 RepID=A0ABU4DVG4_9DEIO|nr:toprim domain-containing protein [Deinococcus sp. ZS9-10]MDV6376425.1 bifunctional DNA primase/polymerase [Deinococcus sp. ZS9-10]
MIATPEDAEREMTLDNREWNVGVLLGPSGLISLDIDRLSLAREAFAARGLDLDAIMTAHPRPVVGKGAKLHFRLPDDVDLPGVRAYQLPNPDNVGPDGKSRPMTIFELRAAPRDGSKSVQDVFPGSLHPDPIHVHGEPMPQPRFYRWGNQGAPQTREDIPLVPPELLELYWALRPAAEPVRRAVARQTVQLPSHLRKGGEKGVQASAVAAWVRENMDLTEVLGRYRTVDAGGRTHCTHPDHPDADGSMHVRGQHATCFGQKCRQDDGRYHSEDVISVIQRFEGLSFWDAIRHLCDGEIPDVADAPAPAAEESTASEPADWTALADAAHTALLAQGTQQAVDVLSYLYARGLSDDVITAARLGVIDSTVSTELLPLNSKGQPARAWVGRLTLPDLNAAGHATGIAGRTLEARPTDPEQARWYRKYLQPRGAAVPPYRLDLLRDDKPVLLAEGQLDALSVLVALPTANVAALAGTGNIKAEDVAVLAGKKVYLLLDPDTGHDLAGTDPGAARGARAAITALQAAGAHVYLVPRLADADLNETLVGLGAADFAELLTAHIRAAQPLPAPRPALDLSPTRQRWL